MEMHNMEFLSDVRKLHVENVYPKIPYDRRNEFQCSHCYKIFPIRGLMNAYWAPFEGFTNYWIKKVICNRCYVQAESDNIINEDNVCIPEEDTYAPQELEILYVPNQQVNNAVMEPVQPTTIVVAKGLDINEVKLVNTTTQ